MAKITFKSKILEGQRIIGFTPTNVKYIKVPKLTKQHCDMNEFRSHRKFGTYANSDVFPAILARVSKDLFPNGKIYLDDIPENVEVDDSGFLAVVSIEV